MLVVSQVECSQPPLVQDPLGQPVCLIHDLAIIQGALRSLVQAPKTAQSLTSPMLQQLTGGKRRVSFPWWA